MWFRMLYTFYIAILASNAKSLEVSRTIFILNLRPPRRIYLHCQFTVAVHTYYDIELTTLYSLRQLSTDVGLGVLVEPFLIGHNAWALRVPFYRQYHLTMDFGYDGHSMTRNHLLGQWSLRLRLTVYTACPVRHYVC